MVKTKINSLKRVLGLVYALDDKFKNIVKKKAKREKVGIAEILDYYASPENFKELTKFFKKEKLPRKFKKSKILSDLRIAKNPKELAEITQNIFRNIGLSESDFEGYITKRGIKEAKWIIEGLIVLVEDKR
ncbi:hypothetical protein ES703_43071 [subsurface metagenome]